MAAPEARRFIATAPLPPRELERRLNAEALLNGGPLNIWGWACLGHFRLRRGRFFGWHGKFVLTGRISAAGEGSRLTLRYRRSVHGHAPVALYYLLLTITTLALIGFTWAPGTGLGTKILVSLAFAAFWLLPLLMVWKEERGQNRDLSILLDFLEREIGATIIPGVPGQSSGSGVG